MKAKFFFWLKSVIAAGFSKVPSKYLYGAGLVWVAFVLYFASSLVIHTSWALARGETSFVMEGRDRVVRDEGSSYEVYTSVGIFTNQDSLLRLKRDSGDLQNDLRPGRSYDCKTQGYRFRYLNLMPNLISCTEQAKVSSANGSAQVANAER